jgi:hypothetical protein
MLGTKQRKAYLSWFKRLFGGRRRIPYRERYKELVNNNRVNDYSEILRYKEIVFSQKYDSLRRKYFSLYKELLKLVFPHFLKELII